MFRLIIAGGRDFDDYSFLRQQVDYFLQNVDDEITIVSGMARGADTLGRDYAIERGYHVAEYPADWKHDGRAAGYKRNIKMAENADALVAFWDGKSHGTKHMIQTAKYYGLPVRVRVYRPIDKCGI
jgi:hypothetical protein